MDGVKIRSLAVLTKRRGRGPLEAEPGRCGRDRRRRARGIGGDRDIVPAQSATSR
jgi:hypothetical protein